MQISKETRNEWDAMYEHGDYARIAKLLKLSRNQAATIIKTGEGKATQIIKINLFYKKRKQAVVVSSVDDHN